LFLIILLTSLLEFDKLVAVTRSIIFMPLITCSFLTKILKAFQRHYRQELINGHVDKECLIIAQNLEKNIKNS